MAELEKISTDLIDDHPDNSRLFYREEDGMVAQLNGEWPKGHSLKVRKLGDRYQIIAGHHRIRAARKAGIGDVWCWVKEMSDDEALVAPVGDNLDANAGMSSDAKPSISSMSVEYGGSVRIRSASGCNELAAYLNVKPGNGVELAQVLVWTYRNTMGPCPSDQYKLNWQAILYYKGAEAGPLDCPEMVEQFSVQDIPAPDGRQGDRFHAWQKPEELGRRLVSHTTKPGQVVLDPFCCTGSFLIAAAKLGRNALGCDISREHLAIAAERGCNVSDL